MRSRRNILIVFAAVLGLLLTNLGAAAGALPPLERDRPGLVAPSQKPAGTPWAVWEARYLRWYQGIPTATNPAVHPDGKRNCELRHGVVFVVTVGDDASCEVPADHIVLFSFLGWSCSTAEGNGRAWRTLRHCARENFRKELTDIKLRLTLDGERVAKPWRWTFDGARGVVDYPKKNPFGVPAGKSRVVGKGLYYALRPMEIGNHSVRVRMLEDGQVTRIRFGLTVV